MVEELKAELLSGRIQKINQPFEQELVLQIRGNRKNQKLLLSAHSVFGRIQRTQTNFENPAFPNTFIMVMRKYLQGAVIEGIEQMEKTGFSKSVSPIKTKLEMLFLSASWSKSWVSTVTLFSWTAPVIKSSKPLNMSASHKIATGPFSLDQPM